jgi:NAD(P)-dependent dehydrogenase (short-subunit alcohol dehydrogenase family)
LRQRLQRWAIRSGAFRTQEKQIPARTTKMDGDFSGKVVIVTGATSGIGQATALRFAKAGAAIAAVGRKQAALAEVSASIKELGGMCLTIQTDLSSEMAPGDLVSKTLEQFGGIDVLVNAAGHISSGTVETTSLEAWDKMLDINLRSVFRLMQEAIPSLVERRGNIVNVSSVTGLRAFPGVLAYCVSKAGMDQLTRCAALELAAKGVRVNAVNPGVVVTEIHKRGGMRNSTRLFSNIQKKRIHSDASANQARLPS